MTRTLLSYQLQLCSGLVLLILSSLSSLYAQNEKSQKVELYEMLSGTFIIKERPKDFKVNFVWVNTPFENETLGSNFLHHKRVLSHAPDKPLVQLIMQVVEMNGQAAIQYYAMKKSIEEKISNSADLANELKSLTNDDIVLLSEQTIQFTYENEVFDGKAEFPTVFRGSDYGKIEMVLKGDTIYNWTRYFKKDGTLVYGPKEKGYLLKKSS